MAITAFVELSIILVIAMLMSALMRFLKQPAIIGYVLTGVLVGPIALNVVRSEGTMSVFSEIGIAFLLFIVGLTLSPKIIKEVGKVSLVTGIGQVTFTFIFGFLINTLLGFSLVTSLYVGIAITFSSTIIIIKLLSDKHDMEKLYGKISLGILLIQDVIVLFLLIAISSFSNGTNLLTNAFSTLFKGIIIIAVLVLFTIYLLPKVCKFFARTQEYLFLFSIAWGLGLASLFNYFGFSIEMGALIAGVTFATSPYHYEVSSRVKPLRDFFLILFFVLLGSQMAFGSISNFIIPAIVLSIFVLIGKPLIIMIIMGWLGYDKKTGFFSALAMSQISEFSLILVAVGAKLGHLTMEIVSLVTMVGIITIAISTYLIIYSPQIYDKISGALSIFERKNVSFKKVKKEKQDIILFGYDRIGYDFVDTFKKLKKKFLVVDYNPEKITELEKRKIKCIYGDANDTDFLEQLNINNAKMIVSTIPDFETNLILANYIKKINKKIILLLVVYSIAEANELYKQGATYVIMPHFLGGSHASNMIQRYGFNVKKFTEKKKKHIQHLKIRLQMGHEHPKKEKD